MPELPEVEVTRRGLLGLVGRELKSVCCRVPKLRYPLPSGLNEQLVGEKLQNLRRRGKYLLFDFPSGCLLIHLGMSGRLRILLDAAHAPAPQKHDHFELAFDTWLLRLHDPRRFGAVLWLPGSAEVLNHPLLASLGLEPLEAGFTARWLYTATRLSRTAIKPWLMNNHHVVGIGNIYASESLFRAAIDPRTSAGKLGLRRLERLVTEIRATLNEAITAGGSSLRDFAQADGHAGYFQQNHYVYGRAGRPCRHCGQPIQLIRQAQRASYYCGHCQRR